MELLLLPTAIIASQIRVDGLPATFKSLESAAELHCVPYAAWLPANCSSSAASRTSITTISRSLAPISRIAPFAIVVTADFQEEHGRDATRLRMLFEDYERVRLRRATPRDRIAPDERLRRAIVRACTQALRLLSDWWIARRANKELLSQRAVEMARSMLQ